MKNIYLVFDCEECKAEAELINAYETEDSAREAVLNWLKDKCSYTSSDWLDLAIDCGFNTVEDFQEAILRSNDYDEDMQMKVIKTPLYK